MNYELARELPYANIGDKVLVHTPQKYIEVESTKYSEKRFIGMGNYDDLDDYILEGWIKKVEESKLPRVFWVQLKRNSEDIWKVNDIAEEEGELKKNSSYQVIKVREVIE